MLKKLTALAAVLAILTFTGVGFTGDQIFNIIEDRDPEIEFEVSKRFNQIFGGGIQ